jgi:predicted amidophosphoribosyltransferase
VLPAETIIVPIPTIAAHVRQRGYDHIQLVARQFAKLRGGMSFERPLERISTASQRGANKRQRFTQAESAFRVTTSLKADRPYLLIDDVVTTNATLRYAALALRDAGAQQVWVAVIARQPLDKLH